MLKSLSALLIYADPSIQEIDFISAKETSLMCPLLSIRTENTTKYMRVEHTDPIRILSDFFNTLDDYHLENQFLSPANVLCIEKDIQARTTQRNALKKRLVRALKSERIDGHIKNTLLDYVNDPKRTIAELQTIKRSIDKYEAPRESEDEFGR